MQSQITILDLPLITKVAPQALPMFILGLFLLIVPFNTHAQATVSTQSDMNATIKNALLTDPRAQALTPAQINAISLSLAKQAQVQGMTPHDLLWRPVLVHTLAPDVAGVQNTCGIVPGPICAFNKSVGLSGSDMTIMTLLGVVMVLILALTAGYLELRHRNKIRLQASV